jgi:hypothetical protein
MTVQTESYILLKIHQQQYRKNKPQKINTRQESNQQHSPLEFHATVPGIFYAAKATNNRKSRCNVTITDFRG